MTQARDTAAARVVASIDATLERFDELDHEHQRARAALIDNVHRLAETLAVLTGGGETVEVVRGDGSRWTVDLETPEPALEGLWGDYGWELGHGSETIVLTWRGAGGVIADQADPFEAVLFARSIEAQAFEVLERYGGLE